MPAVDNGRRKRLSSGVEAIIAATLREQWLVLEAPPLAGVVAEIRARCEEAGMPAPSYDSVERRIPVLFTPEEIARGRHADPRHLHRLKPRPGYIHAEHPLDICQIDHTPTDINFVEVMDAAGTFVGRAYLTIVTDVFSRCILGFCLTLEKPSSLSVALCLAHAMCAKDEWMITRGLDYPWPVCGRPRLLVTDSAKEFKGHSFQRGCNDFGIRIRYRDRGRVHHGGVVERLLGKLNAVVAKQSGSTGRSVAHRDGYPSAERACLGFADLERCITLAVIDHNLQQNGKTLKVPLTIWQSRANNLSRFKDDPHQVLLAFLPGTERKLTPQGLSMFGLHYYSPWLGILVPERDQLEKLEVRYDQRDISRIYVRDPMSREFRPVLRRDGNRQHLTLWEHLADRTACRVANFRSNVAKVAISRQITQIVQSAKDRKAQLRTAARTQQAGATAKPYQSMEPPPEPAGNHPPRQKQRFAVEEW